ncbi:MAG: hypothetical protein H7Z14_21905 [Anaerolineae bacterium]|nr:hypothetical protein [Phycisphaerae bacterium]
MTNFIRDNKKKFLAVLGVVLMVAFILPSQSSLFDNQSTRYLAGTAGDRKIYNTDLARAKEQWDLLEQMIVMSPEVTQNQAVPVANFLRRNPAFNILAEQVANHPEMYYLLQEEAIRNGIVVLPGDMDEEMKRRRFAVRLENGTIVALDDVPNPNVRSAVRDSVAALVRVQRSFDRAITAMKISRPLREHEIARQLQQIQLDVVELSANDLLAQVSAPTAEDLKKQFETFADYYSDSPPTPQNPHGFGYKYPNRVTLQYLGVRHDDVRKAVLGTKSDYDWTVDARKYYMRRQSQFPATRPATLPTSMSSLQPTTGPTTKPFEEVRDEIVETLMAPEIARKARDLQDRINARLRADYDAWHAQNPNPKTPTTQSSTQASTAPASTAPAVNTSSGYASFDYLQKLAAEMQQQTGVLPVIASLNQYQTVNELQALEGLGQATVQAAASQFPFASYATQVAAELVPESERNKPIVLPLYKPSPVLRDAVGSSYVFRLTGALPASKPNSIDEVADAVQRDWRTARAYELAMKRARDLLDAARPNSLASAARESNLKSVSTGTFDLMATAVEGVTLPPEALTKFRFDALGLLSTAATQPSGPPLRLIELPIQGKIFVAQLTSAKPRIDTAALPMIDAMVENELTGQIGEPVMKTWYDFNQVVARTGWKDETDRKKAGG